MGLKYSKMPMFSEKDEKRFWQKVLLTANIDLCWIWESHLSVEGYGHFWLSGGTYRANRLAYYFSTGKDPYPLSVCHTCDNPKCCNPNHLFIGTHAKNMEDKKTKNRVLSGERSPMSKLNWQLVNSIREEYALGCISQRQLAKKHNTCQFTIACIVQGKTWKTTNHE